MKQFSELTLKGQKMRIVKDAIFQIKKGQTIVQEGTYLRILENSDDSLYYYLKDRESLQKVLEVKKCEACAKGAIFASCILNVNKVKGSQPYMDESFFKKRLKIWFTSLELDMIETAFEKEVICNTDNLLQGTNDNGDYALTKLGEKCIKFGKRYKSDKNRLLGILNNILTHGTFKP